ncbi:MAG: Eco57I restriction-modification methylase domain-containing protein, partial [Actinomycetota bacterium]
LHTDLVQRIEKGEISSVNELISANLDVESLAIDVIDRIDSPADIVAAWQILTDLKIIDPTCGSGTFLFAALRILHGLYAAVLDIAALHARTSANGDLRCILDAAGMHPNRDYFILKHATLSNLYGVDIMHEAVEIAHLRIFLKLISAIKKRGDLEPLPDLDFNIKPGNILVGALTSEGIELNADKLLGPSDVERLVSSADQMKDDYRIFRDAQEAGDEETARMYRTSLSGLLNKARDTADRHFHMAQELWGSLDRWRETHAPFHWFLEYPEVIPDGGFDVVIGNPPYVALSKVKSYRFSGLKTQEAPDIYAPCCERAAQITRQDGRLSMILPISAQFSKNFMNLRSLLEEKFTNLWISSFSRNPAALFSPALGVRNTILIGGNGSGRGLQVTKTHRWYEDYRPSLFETLKYTRMNDKIAQAIGAWPRTVNEATVSMMMTMLRHCPRRLATVVSRRGHYDIGIKSIALYWISCYDKEPPSFTSTGQPIPHTAARKIKFEDCRTRDAVLAIMASKAMLFWWACNGDDFNVTAGLLTALPIDLSLLPDTVVGQLSEIGRDIAASLPNHVQYTKYAGKWMGNYVLPELREVTNRADRLLARTLGYEHALPDLELFYWSFYKPTAERPGTVRRLPAFR